MNCPKHFCFHWIEKGDKRLPFQFNNIEEALNYINDAKPQSSEYCGCIFGNCNRIDSSSNTDWYEPNEPALEKAGLPEDSFIENKHDYDFN